MKFVYRIRVVLNHILIILSETSNRACSTLLQKMGHLLRHGHLRETSCWHLARQNSLVGCWLRCEQCLWLLWMSRIVAYGRDGSVNCPGCLSLVGFNSKGALARILSGVGHKIVLNVRKAWGFGVFAFNIFHAKSCFNGVHWRPLAANFVLAQEGFDSTLLLVSAVFCLVTVGCRGLVT